ncbi:hypothetical protein L0F63_004313, partial [Massospora cicadina]
MDYGSQPNFIFAILSGEEHLAAPCAIAIITPQHSTISKKNPNGQIMAAFMGI